MTTTNQRIQVTITPDLQEAIDLARAQWPDLPISQLVAQLALLGAKELHEAREARLASRRAAIAMIETGIFNECYPPGYLEEVREGWIDPLDIPLPEQHAQAS